VQVDFGAPDGELAGTVHLAGLHHPPELDDVGTLDILRREPAWPGRPEHGLAGAVPDRQLHFVGANGDLVLTHLSH
jgi:hypothetical protein